MAVHNCKFDAACRTLEDLVKVQCSTGNYDYDPYMHGMANGLICALACIKGERAEYIDAPEVWLHNRRVASKPTVVSETATNTAKPKSAGSAGGKRKRTSAVA